MPTYGRSAQFNREFAKLSRAEQVRFLQAVEQFVADLRAGQGFRKGLRVKRVRGTTDVWELTWAPDGRATWQYGPERRTGEVHVISRRVGSHSIFRQP